jgi:predicted nucleic acid-binding protein
MKTYADTSFLGSLYIASDAKNADALAIAQTWGTPPLLPFTPFSLLEFRNMLARLRHKGILRPDDARQIEGFLKRDLKNGTLEAKPLHAYQWIDAALDIADNITPRTGTRTLDAAHIAFARLFGATGFISFDKNQRRAAVAAGLALIPA